MKPSPRMIRILQTININIVVFCMGMTGSADGINLLDLAEVYNTDVKTIAYAIISRGAGNTFGALVGSLAYRSFNMQLVVTTCVLLGGLSTILLPLVLTIPLLHVVYFVIGASLIIADIGMHVWLQMIWMDEVGPQLQLYNLLFGLGGVIAPFICEPFLSSNVQHRDQPSALLNNASARTSMTTMTSLATVENTDLETMATAFQEVPSASRIHIGYGIIGSVFLAAAVSFLVSYGFDSTDPNHDTSRTKTDDKLPKKSKYIIIALVSVYMLLGVVDEITFAGYLPTFAVRHENLRFTKSSGAYLASVFWMSYTIGRFVATLLILRLSPGKLIAIFQSIMMIATVGLLLFVNQSRTALWLCTAVISFGLGPFFANGIIWGAQYMILTHYHMSVISLCTCTGSMLPGILIGPYIDAWPMVVMWVHGILAVTLTACVILIVIYGRTPTLRASERRKTDKANAEAGENDEINMY